MNRATGLVLPSLRESFGLVFIEALFAGLPIIYPKGAAVDGYFDNCSFAIAVDARDPEAIAAAIERLVRDEAKLKADLLAWQNSAEARRFTPGAIARAFTDGLNACVAHR
jgi:glycosyltransferase involved in cell wall biosynthesis